MRAARLNGGMVGAVHKAAYRAMQAEQTYPAQPPGEGARDARQSIRQLVRSRFCKNWLPLESNPEVHALSHTSLTHVRSPSLLATCLSLLAYLA